MIAKETGVTKTGVNKARENVTRKDTRGQRWYDNFMTEMKIIKDLISRAELKRLASEQFGNVIKVVVDVEQEIMAIGGELHVDMEVLLVENENSKREDTWGVNLYPDETEENFVEFDSMINLKPIQNNLTRNVEDKGIQKKIKEIINRIVK